MTQLCVRGGGAEAVKTPHTPHICTTPQKYNVHTLRHTPRPCHLPYTYTYTHTPPHTAPYAPHRPPHSTHATAHSTHTSVPTPGRAMFRASALQTPASSLQSPGQPHSLTVKPEVSARSGSRTQPGCQGPRRGPPTWPRVVHPLSVLKLPQGANFPPAQRTPDTPGAKTAIS